jgi:hypothetical protein
MHIAGAAFVIIHIKITAACKYGNVMSYTRTKLYMQKITHIYTSLGMRFTYVMAMFQKV